MKLKEYEFLPAALEVAETPPVLFNFKETPVVTHGPYEFATEKS